MNKRCRVLICDDHAEFRELVKSVLKREEHIVVVGEAANGKEVVDKALRLRPDVVLMDLSMPELSGLEATRRIRKASRHIRILIVSAFGGDQSVAPCLSAGASGYFQKYAPLTELSRAIDAVANGGTYISEDLFEKVSRAGGNSLI